MLRGLKVITLALFALVLMSTEAMAIGGYCVSMNVTGCRFCGSLANCRTIFGTSTTFRCTDSTLKTCYKCSVNVEGLLSGLGNVDPNKPNANPVAYHVTLAIRAAEVSCVNQPGNAEPANGQPFINSEVFVGGTDVIDRAAEVTKNGRALSDILFEDRDIIAALFAAGAFEGTGITSAGDLCKRNWTPRVLVTEMRVLGQVFDNSENSSACNLADPRTSYTVANDGCNLTDALGVHCFAPEGAVVNTFFTYVGADEAPPCDTFCSNRLASSTVLACPDPTATPLPAP
jgi:hypothetical protein